MSKEEQHARAQDSLLRFESREIQAMAYIAPNPLSLFAQLGRLPKRIGRLVTTIKKGRRREWYKYTEGASNYSIAALLKLFWHASRARSALTNTRVLSEPPADRFVFFGLHMQPESTVDVWAPFYSNQIWVIEFLARSMPPSHKLLVKIHKSDVSNYSRKQLDQIMSLPGVRIVDPLADAQQFIRKTDLVISIQGTIGLEGALYGKPVIMLGDSPNIIFESVSSVDSIVDLPALVRNKLGAPAIGRSKIVNDYAEFLAPFMPACSNDWSERKTDKEIDGFVELFDRLSTYIGVPENRIRDRSGG